LRNQKDVGLIFSATDLVNFLGCCRATFFDRRHLDEPMPLGAEDPLLVLLQRKGIAHEQRYLEKLKAEGREVLKIAGEGPQAGHSELRTHKLIRDIGFLDAEPNFGMECINFGFYELLAGVSLSR
jgi:hypothetical protein